MSRVRVPSIALFSLPKLTPMTTLEAIILGIIQGLTEFFPVSSSAHLELGQLFLGLKDLHNYVLFNLICHLGTVMAIIAVFHQQIWELLSKDRTRLYQIFLGTLPLFPLAFLTKPLKSMFDQPQYLGFFFLLTALLLYSGIRFSREILPEVRIKNRWRDAFLIGLFQAVAILPGISRSGSTISGGRLLGWSQQEAIQFSFLLAIPAVFGGITLELLQLFFKTTQDAQVTGLSWIQYGAGFLTAFGVGYLTLLSLLKLAAKEKFRYFVWYCLFLGIATILYFHLQVL